MKKNDINLFKAAGGERAKSNKRSSFFYVVVAAVVISLLAIGIAAYFNIMLMNTKSEYNGKLGDLNSLQLTKRNKSVVSLAEEFKRIKANEDAGQQHDRYIESYSKLFPHATESELALVKQAILDKSSAYSVNEPEEGERFVPWDYAQLRASLVDREADTNIEDVSLFYAALQVLEKEQNMNPETPVWSGYYRSYMVVVFTTAETPGYGLDDLASKFIQGTYLEDVLSGMSDEESEKLKNVDSPFSDLEVTEYSTVKYGYVISGDLTFHLILCPMKCVIERAFDILDKCSRALMPEGYSEAQKELVSYFVQSLEYKAPGIEEGNGSSEKDDPYLSFKLVLPIDQNETEYLDWFSSSPFFSVSKDTKEHAEVWANNAEYRVYDVKLFFIGEY